ncbi:sugar ABC transporter substrate-binding protein [Streptomyces sp. NPDC088768]|uniref:sugar ABC transporter substrate-binding protein n=1 Tax=Streptomyces sp. NPDC088768 TaxID=3365894 RepID=UPI0038008877
MNRPARLRTRKTVRNTTVAAASIAAMVVIAACGGSDSGGVSADKKQTLTVWGMGAEGEKLADIAKTYEKSHPNITVKVTPVGWDVAHQKLVSAAAASKLPDIAQMGGSYMGEFSELGVLEPVDTKTFHEKDFFPASWKQGVVDDTAYGVPWYVDTRVVYYRTDLAKKAGITEAPKTWKDMKALATAYQKQAGTRWGLSIQPSGTDTVQSFYPFLYSAGGQIVSDDGKKAVVNSPEAVRALTEYGTYFSKGLAKKSVTPGYDVLKDFDSGSVPMFFSGPWQISSINQTHPNLKGKWGITTVPRDESATSMAGGSSLVISKDSDHKAAATDFVKYLTSAKGQTEFYKASGDLPARTSAWDSGELATDKNLQTFRTQVENSKTSPALAKWSEISSKVDDAIEQVTQGKASAKSALDKAQSEIESLLG